MTCSNCKSEGHNKSTCKKAFYVVEGPVRKRGRPPKIVDEAFPLQNSRRKTSTVTPTPRLHQTRASISAALSSAPPASQPQENQSQGSTAPPAAPRRGRPPGRAQARKVTVPRGYGIYMCPYTNRVFDCFGSSAREINHESQSGRGDGGRGQSGRGDRGRGQSGRGDGNIGHRGRGDRGRRARGRGNRGGVVQRGRGDGRGRARGRGDRGSGIGQRGRGFLWDVLGS